MTVFITNVLLLVRVLYRSITQVGINLSIHYSGTVGINTVRTVEARHVTMSLWRFSTPPYTVPFEGIRRDEDRRDDHSESLQLCPRGVTSREAAGYVT